MNIQFSKGKTGYGTGIQIDLNGDEVATAIDAYLVSHGITVVGKKTIYVNGKLCQKGQIHVGECSDLPENAIEMAVTFSGKL